MSNEGIHMDKILAELESRVLVLNIFTEECFHKGKKIEPLITIFGLYIWMIDDLKDKNQIMGAEIEVKF